MNQIQRTSVFNESIAVHCRLTEVNLEELKQSFSELFDRAAHAVQLSGMEQDDSIVERYVQLRDDTGLDCTIKAEVFSSRDRFCESVITSWQEHRSSPPNPENLTIVSVRLEAFIETWQ